MPGPQNYSLGTMVRGLGAVSPGRESKEALPLLARLCKIIVSHSAKIKAEKD